MKRLVKNRILFGVMLAVCVIACVCASVLFPLATKKNGGVESDAYTGSASLGSLTFNDYDTRTDGNIFDGDVLKKLYGAIAGVSNSDATKTATYAEALAAVQSSTSSVTGTVLAGTGNNTITEAHSMNYATLKNNVGGGKTSGTSICVDFGGFKWDVVYATVSGGDLVVTLWQSENAAQQYAWNNYSTRDMTNAYPSSMYSTSYIRAVAINGGAQSGSVSYATSNSALSGSVTEAQRKSNQYAAFTLDNSTIGQKSLTSYLVAPNQIAYQEKENWNWSYGGTGSPYLLPNEAWGLPDENLKSSAGNKTGGWCHRSYNSSWDDIYLMPSKADYYNWANDTLWLPSLTETGFYDSGTSFGASLWGIPNGDNILKSSGNTWSRSGGNVFATLCFGLAPGGGCFCDGPTTTSACVRPALHLNLKSAAASAAESVTKPAAVNVTYDGTVQTVATIPTADKATKAPWYDTAFYSDATKVSITYSPAAPKAAGAYTATVTLLSTKYKWEDSTSFTGDRTRQFTFTIDPKKITVSLNDTDSDGVPDSVHCDPTQMCGGDSVPNFTVQYGNTIGANDFASIPTNQGSYYATAKITDANCNYEIDTSNTSYYQQFSVRGNITKPYFASGAAGTYSDTAQYTGSNITFPLNGVNSDVRVTPSGSGISISGSDLVVSGGVGTYTANVTLANPANMQWSDGTDAAYSLTITISKGDYDFSNVKWQYKSGGAWVDFPSGGVTYTGSNIEMQVTGLPTGLSVLSTGYTGTGNKNAGNYTATVTSLSGADTANFNPVSVGSIAAFTFNYDINKVQVSVNGWTTKNETISGVSVTVPTLPTNPAYTVVYYADSDWDTANNAPKAGATPLTSSQISYDPTSSQTYYAYAELSSNATYQANYELTGPLAQSFSVGGGKDAVTVSVPTASKVYDGTSFAPTAEAEKDGAPIGLDLVYTYYDSDGTTQLPTAPTNAGSYFVKVAIGPANSADYAISGTSTFAFTIDKAQYDLSGVQWKVGSDTYGLSDNITYVYDGTVRTLSLIGISDVVGGLSVTLGGDYSTKNAGQHTVTLNITQDTQNYEPCALPSTFTWEITKCTVDLSGITWNYDPANPFVFTCDENGPVEFSVAPVLPDGVPDELVTLIESSYGGTYKKMDKGTYRATASIQGTLQSDPDVQNNYTITYPASFAGTLDWKIVEREFDAPVFDGSWSVFDNDVHDLAKTYCLPNDWANYFDIEVKFTLPDGTVVSDYDGHEGDLNKAFNAGTYEITFRVKSGINISADYNVWLGDDDEATVTLEVAPRTITVANWKGMGTKAQPQFADRDVLTDWYDYVIYDADQNPVTPDSDGKLPAGNYTRTIVPTSQNIEIKFAGMEFIAFTVNEDGSEEGVEIIGVDVPVYIGDLTYTGKEVVINEGNVNTYFSGYDRSIMRIVKNVSTLNAGEYTITFALLDPITYVWNGYTGSESEQPEVVANVAARLSVVVPLAANSSEADVDFNVKKAQLSGVWGEKNGIPYLQVPAQYNGLVEFEYSYIDESGNSVAKKDLVKGNPYTVHVTLGEQYTNNFEFVDDEGNILPSDAPMGSPFEYTPAEGFLQQYWQVIVSGVCILLSIIFIILIAVFDSQRRKANKEAKQYTANNNVVGRKQYRTAAVAGVGLFGLAYATWTIIACVLIGVAVVLAIGVIIAKCRSNKAKAALEEAKQVYEVNEIALAEQEEKEEAARLKKEQEEEAKRQKEEEREEEKRRKEEEREEEKRRREEQREEDRRRREEEREDERRRREDERRIAAMSNNNMGMGMNPAMGYGAMPPFAMQYAQPPVVQQQPQPMQVVQPAQQVVAGTDESKLEKAVEKLATELGHQKRVEGFLDMISQSREKDRAALVASEKAMEERKKNFEARRENMSASFEPSVQRVYIPAMPANGNSREKELELELREKEKALREKEQELEREKNKGEKVVQAQPTVAQQPVVQPAPQPAPQPVVQPVIQQVPVQVPVQAPVYPQPMYMPQGYMPSPYWQAPMPQGYAQPSYREYELERELERMRVRDYERMRNLEHELGIDRDRNFYVGQLKNVTPAQPYAQPALPQPQQVVMPQSYVQPQAIPQSYTQATVRELELERDLREKERERTRELERELALEKERNRFAQEKSMGTSQPVAQPQPAAQQPVVVVPPVVQTQAEQQENAQTAQARFLRRNNPFAANRFAEGNDD